MSKRLDIIRGLPGSGKSTFASEKSCLTTRVVEADQFFLNKSVYNWDSRLLAHAHSWCLGQTAMLLHQGLNVCVANTFITKQQLLRYLDLRNVITDLDIVVTEIYTRFDNVHNVPKETLDKMAAKWYTIPKEIVEDYKLIINSIE